MKQFYLFNSYPTLLQQAINSRAALRIHSGYRLVAVLLFLLCPLIQGVVGQVAPTSYSPVQGATQVDVNAQLVLTFPNDIGFTQTSTSTSNISYSLTIWEYIGSGITSTVSHSVYTNSINYDEDNETWSFVQSPYMAISGNQLIVSLSSPLKNGQKYHIQINNGLIQGYSGITKGSREFWNFTTVAAATPPTVTTYLPASGATDVSLSPTLTMTFNEAVSKASTGKYLSIYNSDGSFVDSYNVLLSSITLSGNTVTIPVSGLEQATQYYITVDAGFVKSAASGTDFAGISGSGTWSFTTGSAPLLVAGSLSPAHGATTVALGAVLSVQFDKNIQFNSTSNPKNIYIKNGSGTIVYSYILSEGSPAPAGLSISGSTLTIDNTTDYEYATDYRVIIQDGAIESTAGIPYAGLAEGNWNFRTLDPPAPVGTLTTPDSENTNISILTDVVITYDVAIRNTNGSAITNANVKSLISIYRGAYPGELLSASYFNATISADKKIITIRLMPDGYYFPDAEVRVVMGKVENSVGTEQTESESFTFTTGHFNVWTGAVDSNWSNTANWESGYVEGASVIIESGNNGAVVSNSLSIPNLIILKGAKLTINTGTTLTVNNDFRMLSANGTQTSASLIINGTLSTVASKTFIYQGITDLNYDYYISSPVSNAQKNIVAPAGQVFEYNIATDQFVALVGSSTLTPGKGYGAYAPAGSFFSFSGVVNQGVEYGLSCQRIDKINYGWNLAGNPYPCAIDLQKVYADNRFDNLKPHIYIRDNATLIQNAYNFASKTGTLSGSQVPSMHSFWVQVKENETEGQFTIRSEDRVHNSYNYHKSAQAPNPNPTLKLFAQNGQVKDLAVITFVPGNDDAYDDYDSEKRFANHPNVTDLYFVKEGKRLVIDSYGEYTGTWEVAVGVYALQTGTYTLGIASLEGFTDEVAVRLVDKSTNSATSHDLEAGDYTFTVAKGYTDNRFVLQLSNKVPTGIDDVVEESRDLSIYAVQSEVVIENRGDEMAQYTIYDLSGRPILKGEIGAYSKISKPIVNKGIVLGEVKNRSGVVNKKLHIR